MWWQTHLSLPRFERGFHLITSQIEHALLEADSLPQVGMLNVFIQHTSASLTINENADPTVRMDFESHFNHAVPENMPYYQHTLEGSDDMPAHLKSSILGASLTIPITDGRLAMGVWQGIYLCEHRDFASSRRLVLTLQGM